MISNYNIEQKILSLKKKRQILVEQKNHVIKQIQELGLTDNQKYYLNIGKELSRIPEEIKQKRRELTRVIQEIERDFKPINDELLELNRQKDSEENKKLLEIFTEIFTSEQMEEIRNEAIRRRNGEHPFKLSFSIKDGIELKKKTDYYKKISKEQVDKMIDFRIKLTTLIDEGCEKFGTTEFMKLISPLNRLITPVNELKKIKEKIVYNL